MDVWIRECYLLVNNMRQSAKKFWDKEYKKPEHLSLSTEPAEDLEKFARWLVREEGNRHLNKTSLVVDLGCGNGRNLIFLSKEFGARGVGYEISEEAIKEASVHSGGLPIKYTKQSISEPLAESDSTVDVVLDMMVSHYLNEKEREAFRAEVFRVLKPGGYYFLKTFLRDGDLHAERLLKENAGEEAGTYIHPKIGVAEHAWSEEEIEKFFGQNFEILKLDKSHKHISRGKAFRRRTVSVYLRKSEW